MAAGGVRQAESGERSKRSHASNHLVLVGLRPRLLHIQTACTADIKTSFSGHDFRSWTVAYNINSTTYLYSFTYLRIHICPVMYVSRPTGQETRIGTEQWQSSRDVHRKNATPPSTQRTGTPTQTTSETKVRRPLSILVIFRGVPVGTGMVSPNTVSRPSSNQRVS